MAPAKEIGECLITVGEEDYFFRPSFANMMKIGEPQEIVQAFYDLHHDEVTPLLQRALDAYGVIPAWLSEHIGRTSYGRRAYQAAMTVLSACCNRDASKLTGEYVPGRSGRRAIMLRPGLMDAFALLAVGQSLITHGIIGKAKIRQLQRYETGQAVSEFRAFDYINAARNHFSISRAEAESLTMTEFQLLLAAKYPDQKGFTREEYDAATDKYLARQAKRRQKAGA